MAEPESQGNGSKTTTKPPAETRDRGMFDFLGKKGEDKSQKDAVMIDISDMPEPIENKKPKLMEELHRSHSSSSSCNETGKDEAIQAEEKKGFLDKIKEKLPGQHKKAEDGTPQDCTVEEKKGILEKIKDKLPGCHKNGKEG